MEKRIEREEEERGEGGRAKEEEQEGQRQKRIEAKWRLESGLGKNTYAGYRSQFSKLMEFCKERSISMDDLLTPDLFHNTVLLLLTSIARPKEEGKKTSHSTMHTTRSALLTLEEKLFSIRRTVLGPARYAARDAEITADPTPPRKEIDVKKTMDQIPTLGSNEVMGGVTLGGKIGILMLALHGVRMEETEGVLWKKSVVTRHKALLNMKGKNEKQRFLFRLNEDKKHPHHCVVAALNELQRRKNRRWKEAKGLMEGFGVGPGKSGRVRSMMMVVLKSMGIEGWEQPYGLKHASVTLMLKKGVPLHCVQKHLRHRLGGSTANHVYNQPISGEAMTSLTLN